MSYVSQDSNETHPKCISNSSKKIIPNSRIFHERRNIYIEVLSHDEPM